ncbi:glycosyltransferase family 4 protein [Aestuariivivens sediminis]|uniref:glycosyltransferase family 4 protein n=1 Tax=Aestuariivivens sediminis TaxID=2913557 RepID=UPI001F5920F7|nr:glycosyltransferase family 4 protein [Aestuariivivens sediminis]
MNRNNKIKVYYIFQDYPIFYQPYIPPLIQSLKQFTFLDLSIQVFRNGLGKLVEILPSYTFRKIYEKCYYILNRDTPKLNYLEIKSLKNKVDIVHLMDSYLHQKVYGLLTLPQSQRPKIVITLRGKDTYIKPWILDKWKAFYSNFGNIVDAFIVMSNHQKSYLSNKWGINPERIHVIPISFGNSKNVSPKHLKGNGLKIVSVFRMCWEKNIEGNLRTIKYLIEKEINVHYDLYGDGPDSEQILFFVDKYGLKNNVTYFGKIDNKLLKEKLHKYDIFLQLSHSEALPTSVLEAHSIGIPAIISDSGGLPEAIQPGKSGFCVPAYASEEAADLIVKLYNNPSLYYSFSKAAISYTQKNFSIENEVSYLLELYSKLTKKQY